MKREYIISWTIHLKAAVTGFQDSQFHGYTGDGPLKFYHKYGKDHASNFLSFLVGKPSGREGLSSLV